jgi:CPA2 family monovalent cation:H+ antiporter-2
MIHTLPLITTISVAFALALTLGVIASYFKLPVLVGYLMAGVIIGPHTPGFIANIDIAQELADIGVMLLMFGVGLHFSLEDFLAVRKIALPGALLHTAIVAILGFSLATFWGWKIGGSLVFGLALSVASTVVLLRTLETLGKLDSIEGRIAVGWLVVEDLIIVLVLVLLPPLAAMLNGSAPDASNKNLWLVLAFTLAKVFVFILLMMVVGRKIFPKLLFYITKTGSHELFTLCVIAAALSVAFAASILFGVSFALGAFFAGMVMRESEYSHRAAEESLPLREVFAALFFVSVGMLFNPMILIEHPLQVLEVVGIIVVGKMFVTTILVLLLRYPLYTAVIVSVSLAQIGELSFILAALGVKLGLLSREGQSLILAGALISIAINSLLFKAIIPLEIWIRAHISPSSRLGRQADPLFELPIIAEKSCVTNKIILIGYGLVGSRVAEMLSNYAISYVVVDKNRDIVAQLRANKIAAIVGNASDPAMLAKLHIVNATMLIIATPDIFNIHKMIDKIRELNPQIQILIRTHNENEAHFLEEGIADKVFFDERELANSISQHVLQNLYKL